MHPRGRYRIQSSTKTKEEFEDIKGIIRIRNSNKDRQHNGQKGKYEINCTGFWNMKKNERLARFTSEYK
jgi:uncharacterized beta-barrel protein YwiB (DUF1934 family)